MAKNIRAKPPAVFVAHVAEDNGMALRVVEVLENRGVSCWVAPRDLSPGDLFEKKIETAVTACRAVLVIISKRSIDSTYLAGEIGMARVTNKLIIPFRVENIIPHGHLVGLADYQWVDAFRDWDAAITSVVRAIRAHDKNVGWGSESDTTTTTEQRPAAYRFRILAEKIDVLPEPPEPIDRPFAVDTYNELIAKARELRERLQHTNSARRVYTSIDLLLKSLEVDFEQLRPGVILSRLRSLEADRVTFDSDEGRTELFVDALAMLDDTIQTARDLLAAFPIVRQIETERLALELDRNAEALPAIEQQAHEITAAAEKSDAATVDAMNALTQNDASIAVATDPVLRTSLIADKLLVVGNFARLLARKVSSEIVDVGGRSWHAFKGGLPVGIEAAAAAGPLMALAVWIAGPIGGIAAVAPTLRSLGPIYKRFVEKTPKSLPQNLSKDTQREGRQVARIKRARSTLEKIVLAEARKTQKGARLHHVSVQNGPTPGSWQVVGWGGVGDDIEECKGILDDIAAQLAEKYSLKL